MIYLKDVNDILEDNPTKIAIHFKDHLHLNENYEYMRRYLNYFNTDFIVFLRVMIDCHLYRSIINTILIFLATFTPKSLINVWKRIENFVIIKSSKN